MSKTCTLCETEKQLTEFYYRKNRDVYESRCKDCILKTQKVYYENNKEKHALTAKKYRELNRDVIREKKEIYRQNNREILSKKQSEYTKNRLETDDYFRLKFNLRSRIRMAIKNASVVKAGPTFELLGCSPDDVRIFLEAEFLPGMTWGNYGPVWHIDHIKPCDAFDLSDPEEQKKCFHWTNLQPLWALDNLKKGSRYDF